MWDGGSTVYRTSVLIGTPVTITYTDYQEASTVFSISVSTPPPATITYTTVEGGSILYSTAYIDQTRDPEIITQTLTESGQTVFRTSLVEKSLDASSGADPMPTSAFSIAASTIYSCLSGSYESPSNPANASVQTVTATMYETMDA
jgi:hypothetical protein